MWHTGVAPRISSGSNWWLGCWRQSWCCLFDCLQRAIQCSIHPPDSTLVYYAHLAGVILALTKASPSSIPILITSGYLFLRGIIHRYEVACLSNFPVAPPRSHYPGNDRLGARCIVGSRIAVPMFIWLYLFFFFFPFIHCRSYRKQVSTQGNASVLTT